MELDPQIRLVLKPGSVILLSGAQMHSDSPEHVGIYAIQRRLSALYTLTTFARGEVLRIIDSQCTGTTLRDFLKEPIFLACLKRLSAPYDEEPPDEECGS